MVDWTQLKKAEPLEPTPIEGRRPTKDVICYCELGGEHYIIKAGEVGCELCCSQHQHWMDFNTENVQRIFSSLWKELCDIRDELYNLNEAYRNEDAWKEP